MTDKFGREITYLRLSVTDLCNLRCIYCMPEQGVAKLRHEDILTFEEIEKIVCAAAALGITKVRITGGEPLVRRSIAEICRRVSSVPGISEVCMTTNGTLLPKFAGELRKAGVHRLNISLNSLDAATYREITRGGELEDALRGIDAALDAGFEAIKINVVLMGGINDKELRGFAELSKTRGMHIRFIELMPIGSAVKMESKAYISSDAVLGAVPELMPLGASGVARLYALPGAFGTVGVISPVSRRFCPSCDRIRITSDGKLKPCLHSGEEINLRGLCSDKLTDAIRAAIFQKPQRHELKDGRASGSARDMYEIGG